MKTSRLVLLVVGVAALLGGAFLIPSSKPASAQTTWCFAQDFTLDDYDWFARDVGEGSYSPGVGWVMGGNGRLVAQTVMPANAHSVDLEWTYTAGNGTKQVIIRAGDTLGSIQTFYDIHYLTSGPHSYTYGEGAPYYWLSTNSYFEFNIWASDDGTGSVTLTRVIWHGSGTSSIGDNCSPTTPTTTPTPTATGTITPTPTPTFTPTSSAPVVPGGWSKPLSEADRWSELSSIYKVVSPVPELTRTHNEAGVYLAYGSGYVHSATEGTVTGITPLAGNCNDASQPNNLDASIAGYGQRLIRPYTYISYMYRPENTCAVVNLESGEKALASVPFPSGVYLYRTDYLSIAERYIMKVHLSDDRTLYYLVAKPLVTVGMDVHPGCILGTTGNSFSVWRDMLKTILFPEGPGYTIIAGTLADNETMFDVRQYLVNEPNERTCANPITGRPCALVADSTFSDKENSPWQWLRHPNGGLPGATPSGASLVGTYQQRLNLDPSKNYQITVTYHDLVPSARQFYVQLGTNAQIPIYDSGAMPNLPITHIVDAQTYTQNSNDGVANWYVLSVSAEMDLQTAEIVVDSVCVFESGSGIPQPAGGCLLNNFEFDQGGQYWTQTGTIPPAFGGGYAILRQNAAVSQSLTLFPKEGGVGPQTYKLSVRARRAGVAQSGEYITVKYRWAASGDFTSVGDVSGYEWRDVSTTFDVEGSSTAPLSVALDWSSSAHSDTLHIDRICITTNDGASAPGYQQAPPIIVGCKVCAYTPTGDLVTDFTEYVGWLGCVLTQLWECQMKLVLMGIWTVVTNILTFLGYLRLWLHATIVGAAEWMNGNIMAVVRWLHGEINNAVVAIVYSGNHNTGGGGGGTIWDAITAGINLLKSIVDGIFSIVRALVDLVGSLISLIVTVVTGFLAESASLVISILQSIANGINMAPTPDLPNWIPNCAADAAPTAMTGVCGGLSILESQLQVGPAVYLVPVVMGLSIISQLLWAAEKLVTVFTGGGGSD